MTTDTAAAPAPADTAAAVTTPPASLIQQTNAPPAAAPAANPDDWLPEKYRVAKDDGSIDEAASARKLAQGYGELVKRLGTDDKPPSTPDEYTPEGLPDGFDFETVKKDPLYQGFLKKAHANGLTNKQVSMVLTEYFERTPELFGAAKQLTTEEAKAELGKVWAEPGAFDKNLAAANRGANAYASPEADAIGSMPRLMEKFGTDPDFLMFCSRVGAEVGEDTAPISQGQTDAEGIDAQLNKIYANPAYFQASHPEHAGLVAQAQALFQKKFGTAKR